MKDKFLTIFILVLVVLSLVGCEKGTFSELSGDIQFNELSEEESRKYFKDLDLLELKAKVVDEKNNKIYIAVNLPFNGYIEQITLDRDRNAIINLKIRKDMAKRDPLMFLTSPLRKVIVIDKTYSKFFEEDRVIFSIASKPVKQLIDHYTALSLSRDYMETDFASTVDSLGLYNTADGYRLAYIFSFADTENMNRAGNEAITGVVAVDAQNRSLQENTIFTRREFPGTYRFASNLEVRGWKDSGTLITTDGEDYFFVDVGGNASFVEESEALQLIDSYDKRVDRASDYSFEQEYGQNENGFIATTSAELVSNKRGSVAVPVPPDSFITYFRWDYSGDNLYFTTELSEPSYGNIWSYYTLWRFNIPTRTIEEIGSLCSREFFPSPDGSRIAYNGLDGDVFMVNVGVIDREDDILK